MLTKEAFNALLKTLEEPPEHVVFIFATTEVHKIPMTILSRCQRFDFRRISVEEIATNLREISQEEGVTIEEEALMVIAKKADGALRDAQSIFDQIRSFCGNQIQAVDVLKVLNVVDQELYFRVTDLIKAQDARGGIQLVDEIVKGGYDLREFLGGLAEHLRNLLVVITTEATELVETSEPYRKRYRDEAAHFRQSDVLRLIRIVNELEQAIRWSAQPRFKLEAGLLQLIRLERSVQIDALLGQIDELKKKLGTGNNPGQKSATSQPIEASNEVRVVGQVSAGRLRNASQAFEVSPIKPAQEYQKPITVSAGTTDQPLAQSQPTEHTQASTAPAEPMRHISAEEAYEQWQRWVGEVRKTKIGIGTILGESRLLDVSEGALHIACPDDYHVSSLKRHKEFLVDSFEKLTGFKLRIEPVLHNAPKTTPSQQLDPPEQSTPQGSPSPKNGNGPPGDHPVILALRRELGAEPVE